MENFFLFQFQNFLLFFELLLLLLPCKSEVDTGYLKHDEYSGEQGDGYETNGDGDGGGGRYRQRNRVVFIGRCPLVARVHFGNGRVSRGELRPRHPSLPSRRAVPAATWHVFKME